MSFFLFTIVYLLSVCIYVLFPSSNILSIISFHNIRNKNDFTGKAVYAFFTTFIADTMTSAPLGTFAFAWLLLIGPILVIRFIISQIYHSKFLLLEVVGEMLFLATAAVIHLYLTSALTGTSIIPSINQILTIFITAVVVVLLTKRHITRQ